MSDSQILDWVGEARKQLLSLADPESRWAYRREGQPCVEPTALACLALQAADSSGEDKAASRALSNAARWFASIQQPDGSVGISASLPAPQWPTPYAILVWAAQPGYDAERRKATDWLIRRQGLIYSSESQNVVGYNTKIAGWPWVAGTYGFLEPTAMAVLALRRQGMADHARAHEGLRLIRDRAIATGGWNFGVNSIYGTNLRPQPLATGIALVALSGTKNPENTIDKACSYLQETIPSLRSAQSLSWGLLGLTAWNLRPPNAEQWLEEAFALAIRRPDPAPQLSYLLLASTPHSLSLLGAQ